MSSEQEQKDIEFCKFPPQMVKSGLLANLSSSVIRIYLTILAHANYKTGWSFPSVKTISRLSGVNKNRIASAVKELILQGLIERFKAGEKFRYRSYYRIIRSPKIMPVVFYEKKAKRKVIHKGKDGRFQKAGNSVYTFPSFSESDTCP